MTDITISAQMLSVIKTRFGDYNIQKMWLFIIIQPPSEKEKKRKKKCVSIRNFASLMW